MDLDAFGVPGLAASPLKEFYAHAPEFPTPLEASGFARLPKNNEIVTFLRRLGHRSSVFSVVDIGRSAGGRRIVGVSTARPAKDVVPIGRRESRLRIMIVGSQQWVVLGGLAIFALWLFVILPLLYWLIPAFPN